jgi:HK97 family phage major capsid protein
LAEIFGRQYDYEDEVRERITELDREHAGKLMPRAVKDEWNELNAVIDELEVRHQRIRELYHRGAVESGTDSFQPRRPGAPKLPFGGGGVRQVRAEQSAALRAIEANSDRLSAPANDRLDELVRERDERGFASRYLVAVADPNYNSAFWKRLASPDSGHWDLTPEEHQAMQHVREVTAERDFFESRGRERAMSLTGASGGFAVPYVLDPSIMATSSGAVNPYRAISNVEVIGVDEWRGVSSDGITAAFAAEAAPATDASPTLAQPTVSTEKAFAFVPYTIEIGQDWGSFANEMASLFADAKDILEASKFAVGSGTSEPFGVVTGATTVFTASNTNSLVVADIYGVHNALGPRFRSRAVWTLNNAIADRIRQLSTAGGADLWAQNLRLRTAAQVAVMTDGRLGADLLGKPAFEASGQSGAMTTGQIVGVLGDYSRYYKIVDRIGMTVETIPHLFGASQGNLPTGQRGLYAYWRVGAKVISANAFRALKLA